MTERKMLLDSIAATTNDYRAGDLATPTPEHVDRWAKQFDLSVQVPILREIDYVLKRTYFSKAGTRAFLAQLFKTDKLVGYDPCKFWKGIRFLDIQGGGNSQKEMLALFSKFLKTNCGFEVADCRGNQAAFAYLDDAIFTGNRVRRDLENWIRSEAPANFVLHVIAIALHCGGQYYANTNISKVAQAAGKTMELKWWRAIELEDRRNETNNSDVLRPVAIPNDPEVQSYVAAMKHPLVLRSAGNVGKCSLFSSDAGRQLLELEFLKAGVKIRQMCPNLGDTQRPLGHMTLETLGFGSLIVTFRNCPNNAPLALWAGDPWYPLFPRTSNSETSFKRFMAMLAKDES